MLFTSVFFVEQEMPFVEQIFYHQFYNTLIIRQNELC